MISFKKSRNSEYYYATIRKYTKLIKNRLNYLFSMFHIVDSFKIEFALNSGFENITDKLKPYTNSDGVTFLFDESETTDYEKILNMTMGYIGVRISFNLNQYNLSDIIKFIRTIILFSNKDFVYYGIRLYKGKTYDNDDFSYISFADDDYYKQYMNLMKNLRTPDVQDIWDTIDYL